MLVPGIRATRQTTVNPVLESHYQFFSINGSRPNQNQFMLDGGNNTNLTFNGPEYSPQVEEVQEFRIQTSNFSAEYANSGGGVINVVSKSGTSAMAQRLFRDFDTSVFSFNAPFTFGNTSRLMPNLRSPGVANFDMSLFKNTSINERLRVQFRVEAFNVFNRVQFGVPNTSINSSAFGVISSQQNSPRNYIINWECGYCSDGSGVRLPSKRHSFFKRLLDLPATVSSDESPRCPQRSRPPPA